MFPIPIREFVLELGLLGLKGIEVSVRLLKVGGSGVSDP